MATHDVDEQMGHRRRRPDSPRPTVRSEAVSSRRTQVIIRDKKLTMPREMLNASASEFFRAPSSMYQAGAFVRFLLEGPKSKTKGFLKEYWYALTVVMDEEDKKSKAAAKKGAKKPLALGLQKVAKLSSVRSKRPS